MAIKKEVINEALSWGESLKPVVDIALKKGKEGAAYLQAVLKAKGLNAKILKNNLVMDGYYKEIGKTIYENKIAVNNVSVKENIERINDCKSANDKISKEIDKINQEIKENDLFKDMPDVSKLVSNIQKVTDDGKEQILKFINENKKTSSKKKAAKKTTKAKKSKKV